jgi:hypothetical protein
VATDSQVAEFRQANQQLVQFAQRDLTDFWNSLNLDNPDTVRDALLEFFPDLVQTYGDTAAVLGADWYDMLRDVPPSAAKFRATIAQPADPAQAQQSARWGVGPLFEQVVDNVVVPPNPAGALSLLMGATQRLVRQPGRDSIWDSAAADPVPAGVARVPSGSTTCKFCVMLASRGPIYKSQVSAELVVGRGSNRTGYDATGKRMVGGIGGGVKARGSRALGQQFHDHCDCESVVIRSPRDYPAGYDPAHYLDLYKHGSGEGRDIPVLTH